MFVAVRRDCDTVVGPFVLEANAILWASIHRFTTDETFVVRPVTDMGELKS